MTDPLLDIDGNALNVGDRVQILRSEIIDPLHETMGVNREMTQAESQIRPTPIESCNLFMQIVDIFGTDVTVENQWQSFVLSGLDVRKTPQTIDWTEAEQDYYRRS